VLVVVELVDVDEVAGTVLIVVGGTVVSATLAEHAAAKRHDAATATGIENRRCTAEHRTTIGR
jgi:hypothetical protein